MSAKGMMAQNKYNYINHETQVSTFSSEELDAITVYRSSRGSLNVLQDELRELVKNREKDVLITCDFNISYMKNRNNCPEVGYCAKP